MSFLSGLRISLQSRRAPRRKQPRIRSRWTPRFEQLESRQLLSVAPPIIYNISSTYGEKDWGWGVGFGEGLVYSATASGDSIDYHRHYLAVIGRAASGGSYVDTNATTDGPTIELNRTDYLNWPVGSPPLGIDFGWPWLTDHVTVTAYVRGSGNTPFVTIVNGQGSLNSNGPAIELGGRLILQRGSLGTIDIGGTTIGFANNTYPGATQNVTPIMVDGIPYTPAYQYSLGSDVHQNGGYSRTTYTATVALSTTIQTWIDQGQAPVAIIDSPERAAPGGFVTLNSLSYDPDNGSTTPDSGIWLHKWTVTGPDGFHREFDDPAAEVLLPAVGTYDVTLEVVDDEGVHATTNASIEVADKPDISLDSLLINGAGDGISFTYRILGSPLPSQATFTLYWVNSATPESRIVILSRISQTAVGSYGPIEITAHDLV